jgi:hypothetical protein
VGVEARWLWINTPRTATARIAAPIVAGCRHRERLGCPRRRWARFGGRPFVATLAVAWRFDMINPSQ